MLNSMQIHPSISKYLQTCSIYSHNFKILPRFYGTCGYETKMTPWSLKNNGENWKFNDLNEPPPPFGSIVSIRSFNVINKLLTAITIIKSQRQDLVWSNDFQQFETTGISGNLCIVDVHIWTIIFKTYCRDYDTS